MVETLVQPESKLTPVEIRRAVSVLWLFLLLALAATIIDLRHVYRKDAAFSVVVQILNYGFLALLIWKVSKGRNWARITWALLFVGGCLVTVLLALFSTEYRAEVFGRPFLTVVSWYRLQYSFMPLFYCSPLTGEHGSFANNE